MTPQPFYHLHDVQAAYQLRYNWSAWPAEKTLFPARPTDACFEDVYCGWEADGIRVLDIHWAPEEMMFLCSVTPHVSPVTFTTRMKGRLQYTLKKQSIPIAFSHKVAMNTVGDSKRCVVETYIENQVENAQFASEQHAEFLKQFTVIYKDIDLANPIATKRGRYFFNLHLVLVVDGRVEIEDGAWLARLRDTCLRIASVKKHRISALSIMPDHLHIALSGDIFQSPGELALCYMNNLSHVMQRGALWRPSYYVGSFGEYNMHATRARQVRS